MTSTPELLYPAETPMQVLEKMRPFRELMMLYECAMREVSTFAASGTVFWVILMFGYSSSKSAMTAS